MTDETKRIFNAPLKAEEYKHGKGAFVVRNNGEYLVAENMSGQDANRLARLPELYDALKESVNEKCRKCINDTRRRGDKSYINPYDFIELGCPYNRTCVTSDYLKLLRKVRDGK